jgi:hypothetical protein
MMDICPYCNGMEELLLHCPSCSIAMDDCGTLQESLGPYAPFEENSLVHAQFGCTHRLFCHNCRVEYYFTVPDAACPPGE